MLAALVAAYTGLTTVSARAGQNWDGGAGGSFLWSDDTNWDPNTPPAYGTLVFAGGVGNTNVIDAAYSMNQVNWNGTSAWILNASGAGALTLYDNGGTQAKLENNSTGVVTVNADVIFAANNASPPNPFGEINAVNAGIVFGSGKTLTVNGSSVDGIKLWGAGQTTDFNGTVAASTKYFATTGTNTTMGVAGAFTSGDIYLMNGGVLKLNTGGSITTSGLRLGGDFGTTGNQDLTKGGTLQLTVATGTQSFAGNINSVSGNTSGALLLDSQNTSGTNTLSGNVFLDSDLASQVAAGGTLAYTGTTLDLKGNTFTVGGAGTTTIANTISNSIGTGKLTKTGAGTLTLSGTNTYAGLTSINGGTVNISLAANLGSGIAGNTISFGGGTLAATAALDLGVNRALTINAGGGTLNNGTGLTLTVSGTVTSGAGNALTKTGLGTVVLGGGVADTAANATAGQVIVNGGVVDLNKAMGTDAIGSGGIVINSTTALPASVRLLANNQINDAAALTLNSAGGTLANFNLNNFSETLGAITMNGTTNGGNFVSTGAAGVLTLTGNLSLNNNRGAVGNTGREVTITGTGTYATSTPSGFLDLGGAVRTITVGTTTPGFAKNDATIETLLQNGGIIKAGTQTLNLLNNGNTFAGGITANAGLIAYNADGALGNVSNTILLDGGGLSFIPVATHDPAATRIFTLGAAGGTFDVVAPGSTGKILINDAGQLTGSGMLTKTGAGVVQIATANTGFTGNVTISAGTIEYQNADALGTAVTTININGATGDLVSSGVVMKHNVNLTNGGIISSNSGTNNDFQGTINVGTGGGTAALRQFQATATANAFKISGPITGAGNLTATAPSAATLTLAGSRAGHTGEVIAGTNATVLPTSLSALGGGGFGLAGGTLRIGALSTASTAGVNGLNATYYNFGSNPGIASTQFVSDTLYLNPRAFTRTDAGVNMPQAGASGGLPIIPVAGYSQAGAGAISNGAMWKGLLNITTAGTYQFKGNDDDNLVLYIDGVQIGTLGVVSALTNIGTAVPLSAGAHSIVVKHTNGTGGGYARVLYNGGLGSDAPADELLGADAGSVTTGSLNAIDLGAVAMTAGSTLDLLNDATTSSLSLGNGTLTITSQTLNGLSAASGTITAATPTLAVQSNPLIFTGGISESSAGLGLNIAGPGVVEFQAANNYTGTTTVTGGLLRLNASGNSIAGNLTINVANANGDVVNVRLVQANQIADTATLTMTQGILDLGANNDTIGTLVSNGGRIMGGGTLTVANLGASTLTAGAINVNLGGAGGLNKTGTGTLALGGAASTFTGVTAVSNGTLLLNSGSLGAGGAGNETTVTSTGQLVLNGSSNLSGETVNVDVNNGLRVAGGTSTIGTLNFTAGATAPVITTAANGELMLNAAPSATANISKLGAGTLTFNYNVGATLPANVIHNAGALGFNVAQSFGAATIPANRQFKFNVNPVGVDVTAPTSTAVIAGYAADQALLGQINAASTGALALGVNSSNNLDFTADPTLSLGAVGLRTYGGTITPGASGYRLGGGGGTLTLTTPLTGSNALTIDEPGTVDLRGVQTFTGAITVDGVGSSLRVINNSQLGTATNGLTLSNGGTLQLIGSLHDANKVGALFHQVGNVLASGARTITIGTGGGTIDTVAHSLNSNFQTLSGVNALTGSGTLTKTGYGELILLSSSNFSGDLVIGSNGGRVQIRAGGDLPNINSVTIGQSGELIIHNNGALGTRQFPEASDADRIKDTAPITLNGGSLFYIGNDAVATNEQETVGNVILGVGRNQLQINRSGGTGTAGAQLNLTNLTRAVGGGVLHIAGSLGTLGTPTGDNARINPLLLNGVALPASTANGVTLPWATTTNAANFAGVSVTGLTGIVDLPSTSVANVTLTPVVGTRYTFTPTLAAQTLTLAAGNQQMAGLRFVTNLGTPTLAFTNAADTLFLGEGVVIGDNNSQVRAIGTAAIRGKITAGLSGAAAGAKELFFHQNQNVLAVESVITDNNGSVMVHKGVGGGTLELRAANTYSGGTIVHQGRINAIVAGSLGTGPVTVKGSAIELRAAGTTSSTQGFTITDSSELYLQNNAGVYTTAGDRFTLVGPGNMLTGGNGTPGQGLNSLTRVDTITAGGQIIIAAGTHIRVQTAPNGVLDVGMPLNIGTNADLYFNLGGGGGLNQSITVGAGTPWKGLGSSVGTGWAQGTINANSDFTIQGLNRTGGNITYAIGSTTVAGGYAINNLSGGAINAFLDGRVDFTEDTPMVLPSNLTFVAMPGSYVVPTYSQSFGYDTLGMSRASLLAQAGSTIDPGNFVPIGAAAGMPQGMPYPVPSPINTNAIFEADSRLLNNDVSGIGSTTGSATWTLKADSIHQIQTVAAFLGSNSGLINAGQFVYEPGAIIRYETGRLFRHDQFINNEPNGKQTVLEIFNANRDITDAVNPFIVVAPGSPTVEAMTLRFGNGGMITNDSSDRTINDRRGRFALEDGAVLAATTQTNLNITENFDVAAGATVTIGSSRYVDGNPKNGLVQFTGPQSNVFGAGAKLSVLDGSAFSLAAANTFPDTTPIELPAAVTNVAPAGAAGFNPGNGSTLLLNVANFAEVVGHVTGDGSIIANQGGAYLGINATSDFSSNIRFRSANAQQANLWKIGSGSLTLTGSSDSTGIAAVANGKLILSGTGNTAFSENRLQKGGIIELDNTAAALSNRLGGSVLVANALNKNLTPMGGTLNLIGNASTAVEERLANLFNSAGNFGSFQGVTGYTTLKITPGAAKTTILVNSAENFQGAGIAQQRSGTWVINSPTAGNVPMTYLAAGGISGGIAPGTTTNSNGLVQIASPNFNAIGSFGIQAGGSYGSAGTAVAATRPDYLGDANNDGVPEGFMTEDGVLLPVTNTSGTAVLTGVQTSGLVAGMLVQGFVPNGTRILTVDSATQVTLTANTTAAATNMQFISGGMRNLAASEYSSYFRDNQSVGLNVKLAGTVSTTGDTRVQTLTMTPGSTLNITGALPFTESLGRFHLNSGGIFVQSGAASTINGATVGSNRNFLQANGGASLFLHTLGDLNLNAMVFTDNAIVKTGAGTLNVGAEAFTAFRGTLQIDAGTVNLGANNSFSSIRQTNGSSSSNNLYLNGGTLNLNGNSQMINTLNNNNELPGMGGTVTSTTAATITVTGGGRFSGTVGGAISIDKNANNTLLLTSGNPYTGTTLVRAGTLSLRDSGALSGTSSVEVQNATLQFDNSYLSNVANRIAPTVPVTLRGGTINLTGAAGQVASQTINALTIGHGQNTISSNAGGGGANEVNIGNLIRSANSGAVINFGQNYGFLGTAGSNTSAIRDFITNVNGSPLALTNNILPTWIIANGDHFATYNATTGLSSLSNTEDGYANYESGDVTLATATQNVNDGAARTLTASKSINAWRMAPGANITNTYNDGVGLTVASGGLISNANVTISHSAAANARGNSITSGTGELMYWVNQNQNGINIPITGNIDLVKAGGGGLNLAASALITGTVPVGTTITMSNTTGMEVGDPVTSGTASVFPAGTVIQSIIPGVSITLNQAATTAGADFRVTFGNTYTGKTYVNGGTLTLNQLAASQTALAVPGDIVINGATVTEANVGGQLKNNANITLVGGGRFNFVDLAGVTETIGSVTFLDGAGANANSNIDRANSRLTSIINLSAPTAITATNTNPSTATPLIGGFAGTIGFTNAGGSTLNVTSPTAVNGVLATGLTISARIGSVPTGISEGGLIKAGNGLLALRPDQNPTFGATAATTINTNVVTGLVGAITGTTPLVVGQTITGSVAGIPANSYIVSIDSDTQIKISQNATATTSANTITGLVMNQFGNPGTLTDVFNVQSGVVRFDTAGAMGSSKANTTVQSGAVILGSNTAGTTMIGSVTMKDGSTMGATLNSFTLGAATLTAANQSIFNVPSGNIHLAAYDYYLPSTNGGTITINGRLTGSGNINIYGSQLTQGNGGGGIITLGNPLLSGAGAGQNNYSGTISVGVNSILANQVALIAGSGITRTTGNAMGSAIIKLDGGRLRLRDDASTTADVSNITVTYGNNVTLAGNSWIDANRQTSTTASGNIINLGTLTVASGTKVLNVDSGNNYQVGFASLDGPGTLIKAGGSRLNINAIAGTFSGNIGIAGPVGITVGPTFNAVGTQNLVLPTTASLNNFDINGLYITEASKTLNLTGTFAVNANPGTGVNNMANVAGRVAVTNTTVINAATIANNGVIGPVGGTSTLTASTGFTGSGIYLTTSATGGVTTSNPLTLAGNVTAGTLRTAGLNTVTITGSAHTPAAAEVQSGTLKLAPVASVTTTGTLNTFGSAASVASGTTAPIDAVTGTLEFAPGTTATHTGNISNSGLVKVSSGTTTVTGVISGSAATRYVPGLLEGVVMGTTAFTTDGTRPANPGNFGIQMEPRMLQNSSVTQQALTGHLDNDVWVYTGYVKDNDGVFSFAGNQDDNLGVWIDGTLVLNSGGNVVGSTAYKNTQNATGPTTPNGNAGTPSQNFGAGIAIPGYGTGWHLVEIRMRNGTGGAGPWGNNGFTTNYGFGYKDGIGALDGADYIKPIDDGTGNLFLTALGSKGNVQIEATSTLLSGGVTLTKNLTMASATTGAKLQLTSNILSDVDNVIISGSTGKATLDVLDSAAQFTVNTSLNLAAGTTLKKDGPGTVKLSNSTATAGAGAAIEVNGGTLLLGANNALPATSDLNLSTGTTLATGGFSASTGKLTLAGAIIDMGANASGSVLTFTDVGTWSGILNVWNYTGSPWVAGTDKLIFSANINTINLANVNFYTDGGVTPYDAMGGAAIVGGNELVPVPEPSAIMSLLALFGLAGYKERRRFFHFRK